MVSNLIPICYVHHERALGGAPLSLLYLLKQIDRNKYLPFILCLREGPAADLFRKEGFSVKIVPGPDLSHTELVWFRAWQWPKLFWRILGSIPLFFRLRQAMSSLATSRKPQTPIENKNGSSFKTCCLVHLNSSTLVVAALAAKSLSLPVVWHIREPLAHGYFGIRRRLLRWAIRTFANHVIAISQNDAAQLGSIPSTQLSVIHNFVDFSQFNKDLPGGVLRKELQISLEKPIILFLGGSARVKGAEILLEAAPDILRKLSFAHLVIAGEISPEFQLKAMATRLERLHLLGSRNDVPSLLVDASVLVFPSVVPHFARPVIEAAAMAKPVVASDLGGVRELVIRNETAILVPPNHPSALAQAVIELLQDPSRAYRLGQQGYALAKEKFDAAKNAKVTFAVYESIS